MENKKLSYAELEKSLEDIIEKMKEPNQDLNKNAELYLQGQKILEEMEKTLKDLSMLVEDEQKTADEI